MKPVIGVEPHPPRNCYRFFIWKMDYKKVYDKIIQNRLENPLTDNEYGEKHHIIPRSLGGTDEAENLVKLTAREHFICHALLAEMYEKDSFEWYKMNHAFMMMKAEMKNHQRYFNSRLYELKRKDFSKVMSYSQSDKKNSQYGKVWIYNLELEESIKVYKSELTDYLNNGWGKGRVLDFEQRRKRIENKRNLKLKKVYYNKKLINDYLLSLIFKSFGIKFTDNRLGVVHALKELLYKKYVIEDNSTTQIAKEFKITDPTVRRYLIWLNIGTKNKAGKWN